ncbi:MAG TPA: DUF1080 domain-containing protein [Anaerolineaceae bacterium]|nr:DUF1080 domain-containing protein [Anaerolineaceae bacterium]
MKFKHSSFAFLFVAILLTSFLMPVSNAAAQADKAAVTVPTLIAPQLTISVSYPVYKWSKISGATNYQLQVYKGSTKVTDTTLSSSLCGLKACMFTSVEELTYNTYKWRVRTQVGSSWKAWTVFSYFEITSAFNAQFNGSINGWLSLSGAWFYDTEKTFTVGVPIETWSNLYRYPPTYTNIDYSVRMKHLVSSTNSAGIGIRMGSNLSTNMEWYPGYRFYYTNTGSYAIFIMHNDGIASVLQDWTPSTSILPYDWNVLRVIAVGPYLHFYINGTLVANITDNEIKDGYVGFSMFSDSLTHELDVDWARLTLLDAAYSFSDTISPEQQALNDAANLAENSSPEGSR